MLGKKYVRTLLCLCVVLSLWSSATIGAEVLFISSMQEEHMPGDDMLKAIIEGLGHTVTYFDDDEDEAATEAAAAAADVVFISESVGSGGIRDEITEIETPMVITEAWGWDEMWRLQR
jgi:cystathionine beta-lyase/cystathionine gamma-synthase